MEDDRDRLPFGKALQLREDDAGDVGVRPRGPGSRAFITRKVLAAAAAPVRSDEIRMARFLGVIGGEPRQSAAVIWTVEALTTAIIGKRDQ